MRIKKSIRKSINLPIRNVKKLALNLKHRVLLRPANIRKPLNIKRFLMDAAVVSLPNIITSLYELLKSACPDDRINAMLTPNIKLIQKHDNARIASHPVFFRILLKSDRLCNKLPGHT